MFLGAVFAPTFAAGLIAAVFPPVSVTVTLDVSCPPAEAIEHAIAVVRGDDPAAGAQAFPLRIARSRDGNQADLADPVGARLWWRAFAGKESSGKAMAARREGIAVGFLDFAYEAVGAKHSDPGLHLRPMPVARGIPYTELASEPPTT